MNEMRSRKRLSVQLWILPFLILLAWGANGYGAEKDACSLVTQDDINSLFPAPVGPGRSHVGVTGFPECVWSVKGIPKFMLQILPAPAGAVTAAIDPGMGYDVHPVPGLSGEAAVAVQQANPKFGIKAGVAILGIKAKGSLLTFSPVLLDIQEGSPKFELLKKMADKAALRMK